METEDINHPLHKEISLTITTILEEETITTTETTPRIEVDHQLIDPSPIDETTTTIEIVLNPKAETKVEVPDPTPKEGATADREMRDPALKDKTITRAGHQDTADPLLEIAD